MYEDFKKAVVYVLAWIGAAFIINALLKPFGL